MFTYNAPSVLHSSLVHNSFSGHCRSIKVQMSSSWPAWITMLAGLSSPLVNRAHHRQRVPSPTATSVCRTPPTSTAVPSPPTIPRVELSTVGSAYRPRTVSNASSIRGPTILAPRLLPNPHGLMPGQPSWGRTPPSATTPLPLTSACATILSTPSSISWSR